MDISDDLFEEIKKAKGQIDELILQLQSYDEVKDKINTTNETLANNLTNFSTSMTSIEQGANKLSEAADSLDNLSKKLASLDVSTINERLSAIETNYDNLKKILDESTTNLEKTLKKKVNKLEENLQEKIKNSSLYSKVFNK
tara:strand:- start:1581 stop:2006 length:426 start_codon:yes stop_codon:yes gene_type:complete